MTNYDEALKELKKQLLAMAGHAETAVRRAMRAVTERDLGLAQKIDADDCIIDQFEIHIDESAIHLLTMAPLASDLRLITVAMRISQNLERVGDEAGCIARRAFELGASPELKTDIAIPHMSTLALDMLHGALSAFIDRDPAGARGVIPRDDEVDRLNGEVHRELSNLMIKDPGTITRCLALMAVSRSLERVADHATNIAEDVVYLYEGRDIRHSQSKIE